MKRYIGSVLLIIFIAFSVSAYYLQANRVPWPDFYFEKVEGDESAAEGWELDAEYSKPGRSDDRVMIGLSGTEYVAKRSALYTTLDESQYQRYLDPDARKLLESESGFMRGKQNASNVYADDNALAYTQLNKIFDKKEMKYRYELVVEVLDRNTNRTRDYRHELSDASAYFWITVLEVQLLDGRISIAVNGTTSDVIQENIPELWTISIDLESGKAMQSSVVKLLPASQDRVQISAQKISDHGVRGPNPFVLLQVTESKYEENLQNSSISIQPFHKANLLRYDMRTGTAEPLPEKLSTIWKNQPDATYAFDGRSVYQLQQNGDKLIVTSCDVETAAMKPGYTLSNQMHGGDQVSLISAYGNNLAFLAGSETKLELQLVIADLPSGKVLYRGKLKTKGDEDLAEMFSSRKFRADKLVYTLK
ncbi:hypothetical protein FHS18_003186 [Paenibacillus phyllosphaerae]|uniref:Uncharacterized protein n=1 Tax=Paenibacillus phyllosphaerae TaxID=274593 RepID=A0A7W5FNF2_9BACL|nr:hypothetical protein [Paenibacillus phyllosphaerae]MBB3111118.1 hypothetical protein [Paenibacillus phyllosphaerae]